MKHLFNLFSVVFVFAVFIFSSCEKQKMIVDDFDMLKSSATLLKQDTIISGCVGDYYLIGSQNLYVVKNSFKTGHNDIKPTGTFYAEDYEDGQGNIYWVISCEDRAYNCAKYESYTIYFKR